MIHDFFWSYKVFNINFIPNTYFFLRNEWHAHFSKNVGSYSTTKSQLIQHFNMAHPRDIWLAESKSSSRFLSTQGGVEFWFWALFFKIYLLRPTLTKFSSQGGRSRILKISISNTLLVLLSCPLYISGVTLKKIQMSF